MSTNAQLALLFLPGNKTTISAFHTVTNNVGLEDCLAYSSGLKALLAQFQGISFTTSAIMSGRDMARVSIYAQSR